MSDEEEELSAARKRRKVTKNEFIDDEAELSGDDDVSGDETDLSDDDQVDLELVDKDAPELDSDQEEEVRGLYHKQLESEDKRAVLLLQEQLEDKDVSVGQRRRRKFRWQTKELIENSLRRHYDPDDDDSQEGDDDDDGIDYDELEPRLRRPTTDSLFIGSTRIVNKSVEPTVFSGLSEFNEDSNKTSGGSIINSSSVVNDDSNSNTMNSRLTAGASRTSNTATSNISRFLYRDKETVEALSTKETVIMCREEKDRNIQREIKRVLSSKSIFDQLYS